MKKSDYEFKTKVYFDTLPGTTKVDYLYYAANEPGKKPIDRPICANFPGGQVVIDTRKLVNLLKKNKVI